MAPSYSDGSDNHSEHRDSLIRLTVLQACMNTRCILVGTDLHLSCGSHSAGLTKMLLEHGAN
jgi:hypothetical protein